MRYDYRDSLAFPCTTMFAWKWLESSHWKQTNTHGNKIHHSDMVRPLVTWKTEETEVPNHFNTFISQMLHVWWFKKSLVVIPWA